MGDLVHPRSLRDMMVEEGIQFASASQIGEWIGCKPEDVPARLRGARQAQEMACVTNQGWAPIACGRLSDEAFLEPMMQHLGHDYYLTGLSAAARYGASHQACFTTQVATDGHLRSRVINGMARIEMFHTHNVSTFPTTTKTAGSWTGHLCPVKTATPEVVLFDLIAKCPYRAGDSKLNIYCEFIDPGRHLPSLVDPERLATVAMLYRVPDRQRVGFLLQEMSAHVMRAIDLDPLASVLPSSLNTVDFEREPDRSDPPLTVDPRWQVRQWDEMWPDV